MTVTMQPVSSSSISYIGYDYETNEVFITFKNGTTYGYKDIPVKIFEELSASNSIGKYYSDNIRGIYASTKI